MIRNFIFHRVSREVQNPTLEINEQLFGKALKFISSKYRVIRIEDVEEELSAKNKKPLACLTFDDGYRDNLELAVPLLDKYNCKASFYVVTDCVEKNILLWIHHIEYLFLHSRIPGITFQHEALPNDLNAVTVPREMPAKMSYFKKLKSALMKMPVSAKEEIVDQIINKLDDVVVPKMMMSWKELRSLKADGHYIGSHTHTHNILPLIDTDKRLKDELTLPRMLIEKNLGHIPTSIAYPFGFYNKRVKKMTEEAGYSLAMTADIHKLYIPAKHDPLKIPRISLSNESWFKTSLRITNRIEQIKSMVPDSFLYKRTKKIHE